jgi:hypothetical protein
MGININNTDVSRMGKQKQKKFFVQEVNILIRFKVQKRIKLFYFFILLIIFYLIGINLKIIYKVEKLIW